MTGNPRTTTAPVLEVRDLEVTFGSGRSAAKVLKGVSATVGRGQTLGVVGESGSGKSTLAKAIVGLVGASAGSIVFNGADVSKMTAAQRRAMRRAVQMIPQDPTPHLIPAGPSAKPWPRPLIQ